MKTRWQEIRAKYWSARSAQERQLLAFAAVLLLPIIFYFLLWQPAHRGVAKLHAILPLLQVQSLKLQDQAAEVDELRHRPQLAALDAPALKATIEESASRHRVRSAITTLDVQEPKGVRIACEAISFAQWLDWLHDLQQEQHIRAESISVSSLQQAGMVKINATLTSGGTQ